MKRTSLLLIALLCLAITLVSYPESLASPPEVFSFISKPANNSVNNEAITLKVTANVVTGATRYTIELNTQADFSGASIVKTSAIDNQRTLVFTNLAYSTRYYARSTTNVSSGYGKITSFVTRAEAFTTLAEPLNAIASLDPIAIRVTAAPLAYATSYAIQISTEPTFNNIVLAFDGTVRLVRSFNYASTYYARVKTNINTTWGPTTSFSTRASFSQMRLWGLTSSGGETDRGTIYSYSIDSLTFTKHFDYLPEDEWDEANLTSGLIPAPGGGFYALTQTVQSTSTSGSVYRFRDGRWEYYAGIGQRDGTYILASDDDFYITQNKFMHAERVVKVSPYKELHSFGPVSQGRGVVEPRLIELSDGYICGATTEGGLYHAGVIYKMQKDGSSFSVIHHFNVSTDGAIRGGGVTEGNDGYLYGGAFRGGANDAGTIFRLKPDGSEFSILHVFEEEFGSGPWAPLIIKDGVIYGTTLYGGQGGEGTLFRMNMDGSGFAVLHNFYSNWDSGFGNMDALVADDAGNLYGVTSMGGVAGMGTIFKIRMDGSGYAKLHDFSLETGRRPWGLVLTDDTFRPSGASARKTTVAALEKPKSADVVFSPNPFSDQITIQSELKLTEVSVTDIQGRVVYRNRNVNDQRIQIGKDLPAGIYVLKMSDGKNLKTARIVKQ